MTRLLVAFTLALALLAGAPSPSSFTIGAETAIADSPPSMVNCPIHDIGAFLSGTRYVDGRLCYVYHCYGFGNAHDLLLRAR